MKLIRFELRAEPGQVRSGIAAAGRVYETEDGQGIGMHEAADVRPLVPVAGTRSVRFFLNSFQSEVRGELELPHFFYGNANAVIGPNQQVAMPISAGTLSFMPLLAGVVLGDGHQLEVDDADGILLGVTIMNVIYAPNGFLGDRGAGRGFGSSFDIAYALGPAITTPDELDDFVTDYDQGARFNLAAVAKVNDVEVARGVTGQAALTLAQATSAASQTCPLREGDVIAVGPIVDFPSPYLLAEDDEVQVAVESLGAISTKIMEFA